LHAPDREQDAGDKTEHDAMRTHVKSFPQFQMRSVSLANEFGTGRFADTTKREAASARQGEFHAS
jgi:hypothetical protein